MHNLQYTDMHRLTNLVILMMFSTKPMLANYYYNSINISPLIFIAGVDKFGIQKVYSSKPRGEEWYMSNNPNSDPRFHLGSFNLVRNEDGSFKVTSTEIRLGVYTSTGYDQNKIAALDQGKLTQKGSMQNPNDNI